jgi:type II secretory pathway component PulF
LEDAHAKLPLPTRMMVEGSKFLQNHYLFLAAATLVFLGSFRLIIRTSTGQKWWDWVKLKTPVFGDVVYKMALVRFSNVFAVLSQSGIPILHALEISKQVVGNLVFENVIGEIRTNLTMGKRLAAEVTRTNFFPPLFVQMVSVGEETGKLDQLMARVSEYYSKEVNNKLKRLVAALEPVMLVVMAFLVGFVALSLVMALMSVLNTIH